METSYLDISKATRTFTVSLSLGCVLFSAFEARANGYEECNQILAQDIFNKITKSSSSSSRATAEATEAFFSQEDTEAFDAYSRAFKEAKKNGTKIDTEFHYGVIGGELGIDVTSEKQVSEDEFKQKFNSAKSKRQTSKSSKSSSAQDLVSNYATYVRDPGTVNAWKDCVTKTKDTNLYAFASRDKAGKTFINVIWVPGVLAGTIPSIPIDFVTDRDTNGIKIHATPKEQVAMGSGRSFAVTCGAKCDDGFQVTVNGTIKNTAGNATNSFTSSVDVPPTKPLGQCSSRKGYPLGKWTVGATKDWKTMAIFFTTPTGGTWTPASGSGDFDTSVVPSPGAGVNLYFHAAGGSYLSTNKLVVSDDGCHMEGTYADNQGHSGTALYTWSSGQP
jgi:hypothetical protein